jgi:hypothetical protein
MTKNMMIGFVLSLVACTTIAILVFVIFHQGTAIATRPTGAQSPTQGAKVNKANTSGRQNDNSNTTTSDLIGSTISSNCLVGSWDETDYSDASSTLNIINAVTVHSFEFRKDGTFAEMSYGKLIRYNQKCNQLTGWCSPPEDPASASSTGKWSTEELAQLANDSIYAYSDETTTPVSALVTEPVLAGTIVIRLDFGEDNPEYLGAIVSTDRNQLRLFYLLGGTPYGEYTRAAN